MKKSLIGIFLIIILVFMVSVMAFTATNITTGTSTRSNNQTATRTTTDTSTETQTRNVQPTSAQETERTTSASTTNVAATKTEKISESNPQPMPGPERISESNPQPSPSPRNSDRELISKSAPIDSSKKTSGLGPNAKEMKEISAAAPTLVETFNKVKDMLNGLAAYWPDFKGAVHYGSEILVKDNEKRSSMEWESNLREELGYSNSDAVSEAMEYYFEDLFTIYLPGDYCSLVVDTCGYDGFFGQYDDYVALDSLPPKTIWQYPGCGLFDWTCNPPQPGECPEGFAHCGKYKYMFTANSELQKQGLNYCAFESYDTPEEFSYVGETCSSETYAKSLEDGDGELEVLSWECGLWNEKEGEPICSKYENAVGELKLVMPGELNVLSQCRSYKAEDVDGGFHFLAVEGEFSFIRYTYACKNKGFFG